MKKFSKFIKESVIKFPDPSWQTAPDKTALEIAMDNYFANTKIIHGDVMQELPPLAQPAKDISFKRGVVATILSNPKIAKVVKEKYSHFSLHIDNRHDSIVFFYEPADGITDARFIIKHTDEVIERIGKVIQEQLGEYVQKIVIVKNNNKGKAFVSLYLSKKFIRDAENLKARLPVSRVVLDIFEKNKVYAKEAYLDNIAKYPNRYTFTFRNIREVPSRILADITSDLKQKFGDAFIRIKQETAYVTGDTMSAIMTQDDSNIGKKIAYKGYANYYIHFSHNVKENYTLK